jgi:hypothetical protein
MGGIKFGTQAPNIKRGRVLNSAYLVNKICFFPEHVDFLRDNRSDALGLVPTSSGYDPLLGRIFSIYLPP